MSKYPWAIEVKQPVIPGFYPDPSVVRVGDTYYVANSSFEYLPGVPIHASKDLVTFNFVGNALHRSDQVDLSGQSNSMGIFAPTLRHYGGKFYMITTLTDGKWQLLVTADEIEGPWSEPIRIPLQGIDPDLAWDQDGNCVVTFASLELQGIGQALVNPSTGEITSKPELVWRGTGGKFPEGPHLYQIGDWWYLLIAEGGTERGHSVTVARSRNYDGPFEPAPNSPLLSNRGTDFTIQNTGHGDLVELVDGTWAMVFHGTRPSGSSPEWHVLGRETCAVTIKWIDGWPALGEPIEGRMEIRNEILDSDSDLPNDWISPNIFPKEFLVKKPNGLGFTGFIGRRQIAKYFDLVVELLVPDGSEGGIEIRIDSRHWLRLYINSQRVQSIWGIGDHTFEIGEANAKPYQKLRLKATKVAGGFHDPIGPDLLIASVIESNSTETELARLDGRYISTEVAGGMTGRLLGIFADGEAILRSWNLEWKEV